MKIILFLVLYSSVFALAQKVDPCEKDLKKFCEPGVVTEGRWSCLGKNMKSLSKECLDEIQKESTTKHHPCYISEIFYCKAEFGDSLGKHYMCLAENHPRLEKKCASMLVAMRKKGHEYRAKIRSTCAKDFARHCPDMNEKKQADCLTRVYKEGNVSPACKKIIDTATKKKM